MKPRAKHSRPRAARPRIPVALLAEALRTQSEGVLIARGKIDEGGLEILFVNDSFCAITGRPAQKLIGKPHSILHADPADVARARLWLGEAHPGQPLVGEGPLVREDGSTISAAWSFNPLFNRRGRLTHVVAIYRDQTEKRRLQEALVHSQRLDAVGRLAGGVAHDFNNLLSVINGYCEMLAAHVSANPQAMREVAEIHHAGRKAAALVQQLLAFSRRQPFDARIINLSDLVAENATILRRLLGRTGALELDLAERLPNVRTDPAQFQQVLFNLVLNARDALHQNGRINVSTSVRAIRPGVYQRATEVPAGNYVALTVTDNGTGMDPRTQQHLFEPFFTTKPEGKGTGLGLALVHGIVQQSGGYILVDSTLLVGSTFVVLLPPTLEPVSASAPTVIPLQSMWGTESVLLVEGDEVVRKMVAGIFTADGYTVTAVGAYDDVDLKPWSGPGCQLVIGPAADEGEPIVRRFRTANPALRLLCTNQNDHKFPLNWLPASHQGVLKKPFALNELLRAARTLLDAKGGARSSRKRP